MSQQRETHEAEPNSKKPKLDLTQTSDDMRLTRRRAVMLKDFDPSVPSPFDQLPDEVLEHIFTFLDRNSLLNSLLVDRRCCGVIENSSKVMAKMLLKLNLWEYEKFKDSKLQRRYNSIEFIDYQTSQKQILKFMSNTFKMLSPHVKSVKYRGFGRNFSELMNIFANTENLQLAQYTLGNFNPQPLLNIKILKIDRIWLLTPKFFVTLFSMCPNVKQLHLSYCCYPSDFTSAKDYEIQSGKVKQLESLTLSVAAASFYNTLNTTSSYDLIRFGKFENLQNLTLKSFNGLEIVNWKNVIENNPNLKTIDLNIINNVHLLNFDELVSSARCGMELKIRGTFLLTEGNSTRDIYLEEPKPDLLMSEEVFEVIIGEQKQMITFT